MVWRLEDAMANEQNPLRLGLLEQFWLESAIASSLPFETYKRLQFTVTRVNRLGLTKPGWVDIGEGYGEATIGLDTIQEQMYKMGRHIDIPLEYTMLDGEFVDPVVLNVEATYKSMVYEFNEGFVNGPNVIGFAAPTEDQAAMIGIDRRIKDLTNESGLGDAVVETASAAGSPLGPLATAAEREEVFSAMDTALYFLDGKAADFGLANKDFLLSYNSGLRSSGTSGVEAYLGHHRDRQNVWYDTYKNVPIFDVGFKADQATQVIGNDRTIGSDTTCMNPGLFFVKTGLGTHVGAVEFAPLSTREVNELEGTPVMRIKVDWTLGLYIPHVRSMSKVDGIQALLAAT